jgi:protein-tyrosine phosphatase
MAKTRILMICMGNICRSPTAEGVLRRKLEAAGLAEFVDVASAGTHGHYHAGEAPDARAQKHAKARGYDLSKGRARRVVEEDFARFDWLLAMDEDNLASLRASAPADCAAQSALLMAHSSRFADVREVPDPYYGPPAGFDRVLDLIEDACDGLVAELERRHGKGTS